MTDPRERRYAEATATLLRFGDLICTLCNELSPCAVHNCMAGGGYFDERGVMHVRDPSAEYHARVRVWRILCQLRAILGVIGWAAQFCPDCMAPRPAHDTWLCNVAYIMKRYYRPATEVNG